MRSWRKGRSAAAVGTLAWCVLWITGCDASTTALSVTRAGTSTSSPASSTSGTGSTSTSTASGTGTSSTATPTSLSFREAGGTIAEIPSTYVRGVPNRWVLFFHGYNQDASTILGGSYGEVEAALLNAGYIVIAMTNTTQNCYGNGQCNADVAAVAKLGKSEFSLQPEPFVVADSMGVFTVLNAISAGAIHPKAVVGWCVNTDLGWDYAFGGAGTPITADYSISSSNPYTVAPPALIPCCKGAQYTPHRSSCGAATGTRSLGDPRTRTGLRRW